MGPEPHRAPGGWLAQGVLAVPVWGRLSRKVQPLGVVGGQPLLLSQGLHDTLFFIPEMGLCHR